ncbi:MAG: WD40 repeat domain-containing protein [Spirochaetes bacterium]|nr:WD40 repeat domain-containing protein [Spirochaetota bacterium]
MEITKGCNKMGKIGKLILFCLFIFIFFGCSLNKDIHQFENIDFPMIITFWLIGIPYLFGCYSIFLNKIKILYFFTILIIGIFIFWGLPILIKKLPEFPNYHLKVYSTVIIWFTMGVLFAIKARSYMLTVGLKGYYFTVIGVSFLGVCLSSILVDYILIPQLKNKPINIQVITLYIYTFSFFFFLVSMMGTRLSLSVLKIVFKKNLFFVFSTLSIIKFAINWVWQESLTNILWLFPNINMPIMYEWFVDLALSAVIALPNISKDKVPVKISDKHKEIIAHIREGEENIDPSKLPALNNSLISYKIPEGWKYISEKSDKHRYAFFFRPQINSWIKRLNSRIMLLVCQDINKEIDEEEIKSLTFMNLKGRDATIIEDRITFRKNIPMHECYFKENNLYGYVVHFFAFNNEFVIEWMTPDDTIFKKYLLQIEEFIDSFEFKTNVSSERMTPKNEHDIENNIKLSLEEIASFNGQGTVLFSPNGKIFASGSGSPTHVSGEGKGVISIWDIQEKINITTFEDNYGIWSLSFHSDGNILASAGGGTVRLWNIKERKKIITIKEDKALMLCASFCPNSNIFAIGGWKGTIWLWDVTKGKIATLEIKEYSNYWNNIEFISFSSDGKWLASAVDKIIKLWDVQQKREFATFTDTGTRVLDTKLDGIKSISFSPNNRFLAAGTYKTIRLWDLNTRKEILIPNAHESWVQALSFNPDNRILASGGDDETIKLWDIQNKKEIFALKGHSSFVNSIYFSSDGKLLISGDQNGIIKLWQII